MLHQSFILETNCSNTTNGFNIKEENNIIIKLNNLKLRISIFLSRFLDFEFRYC